MKSDKAIWLDRTVGSAATGLPILVRGTSTFPGFERAKPVYWGVPSPGRRPRLGSKRNTGSNQLNVTLQTPHSLRARL